LFFFQYLYFFLNIHNIQVYGSDDEVIEIRPEVAKVKIEPRQSSNQYEHAEQRPTIKYEEGKPLREEIMAVVHLVKTESRPYQLNQPRTAGNGRKIVFGPHHNAFNEYIEIAQGGGTHGQVSGEHGQGGAVVQEIVQNQPAQRLETK
jgi:hypothetical protein